MRSRTVATTLLLAAAAMIGLGGCHDGYSSVGYSYYGSYGAPCDYVYYPSHSHIDYSFTFDHHHHHDHGHWGGWHGGHHHGGHHHGGHHHY